MCEKREKLRKTRSLEWDQAEPSSINALEPYNFLMLLPRSAPFLQREKVVAMSFCIQVDTWSKKRLVIV